VTLSLLSAMAVNLGGYNEPLLAKGLGYWAKASSFCLTTPGAIVLPRRDWLWHYGWEFMDHNPDFATSVFAFHWIT
jgi:hypothetical protein